MLYSERDDCWKLTDFGSASLATFKSLVTTNLLRGTESYRAPEVLTNKKYNNRADIFALGCIIFEIITSEKLFSSDWKVQEYGEKGNSIFPERWSFATSGSHLYDLGHMTSIMLSIDPTQRPNAAQIRRQLRQFHIRQSSPETNADVPGDDDFFVLPDSNTLAPIAPANPTVQPGLRFLSEANPRRGWPVDHVVSPIVAQGLERSHFAPDNSPVASWPTHPAPKRANPAEIKRYNELLLAAKIGNVEDMKRLLGAGADVESKDSGRQTSLSWAAYNGHSEVVKLLLQAKAEVDSKDEDGRTPLSWAARHGHLEIVKFLVKEAGANVESKSSSGRTPLSFAAELSQIEVVKFLVEEAEADLESKEKWGMTPLTRAASVGCLEVVKFLVKEAGADVESKDNDGYTALDLARKGAQVRLLEEGCRAVVGWLEAFLEKKARGEAGD